LKQIGPKVKLAEQEWPTFSTLPFAAGWLRAKTLPALLHARAALVARQRVALPSILTQFLRKCDIPVVPRSLRAKRAHLPMQGDDPQQATPRGTILIVEDNELNLKLLKDVLDFLGYSTVVTGLGEEALDLARQHHPDLILLDIQLPDIAGTEVARRLKADGQTRAVPIIAVTAFAMLGDRQKFLDSGCDDYIAKPFNLQALLALVERHIDGTTAEMAQ
jgi:two-component system cell cycle response regulator DivK